MQASGEVKRAEANANPTKEFFVRMITRDINLEDCILDLIDNSVDEAWSTGGSRPIELDSEADLSPYHIEVNASADRFSIRDNCGGLTLDNAVKHAFSFGRADISHRDDFSIGVYGIGMKRAVFKIGGDIRIRSTFDEADGRQLAFAVPINVREWLKNNQPPWDFDIVDDHPLPENGVEIVISDLTSGSSSSFNSPAFIQDLRRTVARAYTMHLQRGLRISINGSEIGGWSIELRQSEAYLPVRLDYEDQADGDDVAVEIIGGMAAAPPDDINPESVEGDRRFGWYVACNGRIVLAADKTSVSGWGTEDWPQWHAQYSGFIGIVLFTAKHAEALPLTTTKRSVDTSSEVYRRARARMRSVTRAWIAYTHQRKQALDEAKVLEKAAKPVPLSSIAKRTIVALPTLGIRVTEKAATVSYSVPLTKLKKLSKEFGNINMTQREVGLKSFEYAYNDFVGDD